MISVLKKRFFTLKHLATATALGLLSGCSAIQVVNTSSRIHGAEIVQNINFDANPRLSMDLYLPKRDSKTPVGQTTPVIMFFYGGSWNRGEKSEYEFVGRKLASMGYIVAIPNYRLYPEVKYPDFLIDGAQATAKLLEIIQGGTLKDLNPDSQVVFMGHSAGAYNAAMLALDDRWLGQEKLDRKQIVKGLIGMAGAYNIYPIAVEEVKPVFNHPNYPSRSQPIDYTAGKKLPTLLLVPETDTLVSIEKNTTQFHNALVKDGSPAQVVTVKGTDHITLVATLSPLLFFKGSSTEPIQKFISSLTKK